MILQIILALLIVFSVVTFKYCWIKPRRVIKFYEDQLKKMDYKPLIKPYKLFYNDYFDQSLQNKKTGDPYIQYKTKYVNYDIVVSNCYNIPYVQILHVDFIKDFYSVDKHYDYPKPQLLARPFIRLIGSALGFTQGNEWKQKKKILTNIFNFDFLKSQTKLIAEICDEVFNEMEANCQDKGEDQNGKYFNIKLLQDIFIHVTSKVILTSILGVKGKHKVEGIQAAEYLSNMVSDMMMYQLQSPTTLLGDKFYNMELRKIDKSLNHRQKVFKQWGTKIIRQRISQIQKQMKDNENFVVDDVIKSMIVHKVKNNLSDSDAMITQDEIYWQFLGFFLGGTDTTANYLNMMASQIGRHLQIQAKLRQEVNIYMANDDYSHENLKNFKYVEALQKQTTRTYGPGNIIMVRECLQDNYLNGLAIKKGTFVSVNIIPNCHSQKYFKEPLKFKPERWLNGECDNLHPFVMTGFSAGSRSCIGKQLALLQSKIAIIKFMKRYKKIVLPNNNFKMDLKFLYCPAPFKTKLYTAK